MATEAQEKSGELGLPCNLDAECAVLGSMLIEQQAVDVAVSRLAPEAFLALANREMFEAFRDIASRKEPLELLSAIEELKRRGTYESVGGRVAIDRAENSVGSAASVGYYCGLVQEKWIRRRLLEAAREIERLALDEEKPIAEAVELSHASLPPIGSVDTEETTFSLKDCMGKVFDDLAEMQANGGKVRGVSTGLDGMDFMTGGLKKGNLIIVAGRPSMGKTGAACTITLNAALNGTRVLYFSLEMTRDEISQRLLALDSNVDLRHLVNGSLDDYDRLQVERSRDKIAGIPVFIDDRSGLTVGQVRAGVMKMAKQQGCDLVVIDHLHLMKFSSGGSTSQNDAAKWGEISSELKSIAKDYRIPVVALAQLNRQAESRTDKRPQLSDLRESGALEQNADLVIGIFRPAYYEKKDKNVALPTQEEVFLDILKQRNGPTGKVTVGFKAHNVCFFDPDVARIFEPVAPPKLTVIPGTAAVTDPMQSWQESLDRDGYLRDDPFAHEV